MAEKTWKDAIVKVLQEAGTAMSYTDIAETIVSQGLYDKSVGATPPNTVASVLSQSLNREGSDTPFVRVGLGEYALKSIVESGGASKPGEPLDPSEVPTGGVNAFGIYWSRDLVDWDRPQLRGQQQLGASTVDLSEQIGIYLLYDGREVVYVGQATERPIIVRLREHSRDRLQARWDRFSWFGLYAVKENGKLIKETPPPDHTELTRTLEAVLIEAMEPRQNRRRGDVFASIEYIQAEDPSLEKKTKERILREMLEKL